MADTTFYNSIIGNARLDYSSLVSFEDWYKSNIDSNNTAFSNFVTSLAKQTEMFYKMWSFISRLPADLIMKIVIERYPLITSWDFPVLDPRPCVISPYSVDENMVTDCIFVGPQSCADALNYIKQPLTYKIAPTLRVVDREGKWSALGNQCNVEESFGNWGKSDTCFFSYIATFEYYDRVVSATSNPLNVSTPFLPIMEASADISFYSLRGNNIYDHAVAVANIYEKQAKHPPLWTYIVDKCKQMSLEENYFLDVLYVPPNVEVINYYAKHFYLGNYYSLSSIPCSLDSSNNYIRL